MLILCYKECPLLLSTKKDRLSTSHINDLMDKELKFFSSATSCDKHMSTLTQLSM